MDEVARSHTNLTLDDAVLRSSVESRCRQAPSAFVAMIPIALFCLFLLGRGLGTVGVGVWVISCTTLLLVRYRIAVDSGLKTNHSRDVFERVDRQFRSVSIASQTITGGGIWLVLGTDDPVAAYLITLIICLYGVGATVNLAHDYRSVRLSIPLLTGQPALYWLARGDEGLVVTVILVALTYMMISSGRTSQRRFAESISIRFEKDKLVAQLEQEKRTALAALLEAEAANRSKLFFMAAASHDLRQPLYAATILNDALALHALPPDAARLLEQQGKALGVASDLFDNLLDLSRFESGAVKTDVRPIDLGALVHELENEFWPQCAAKGLVFRAEPTTAVIASDYDLLARTLRNLLSNAVRYTAQGGITIAYRQLGADLLLTVKDSGVGISAEDQDRIFAEFVQLNNPQRARDRGVGLGLAIVRHITRLLCHELSIESQQGQGTAITLTLPTIEVATSTPLMLREPPREEIDLTGYCVWVVEDDELVRNALQAYIGGLGCKYRAVTSAAELRALDRDSECPDFAILDDMLGSEASGLELAHWLAERMDRAHILLTTGSGDVVRWKELSESGFTTLRKPVSAAALTQWLSAQLKIAA